MGHGRGALALVLGLVVLALGTAGALVAEARGERAALAELQAALGGLGLGAAVVPAWSFNAFDPRLEPTCESSDWPVPGGACYSPDHVGPVSHFRPPARGDELAGIPRLKLKRKLELH